MDAREALAIANEWKWTREDIRSYVNTQVVAFELPGGKTKKIPLPDDSMVVAVAPYIDQTHQRGVHFMSSCMGELPETTFDVSAVDRNGNTLFNGPVTSLKNGFFELWLPRNRDIRLTVRGSGRKAEGRIGTFDDSKTCVTTFQLK